MITLPTKSYNGIALCLSKPSRFDAQYNRLCSGPVTDWLESVLNCSLEETLRFTADEKVKFPFSKLICCGNKAIQKFSSYTIHQHGYEFIVNNNRAVGIFDPQDCLDHQAVESDTDEDEDYESEEQTKNEIPTKRSNYRFWSEQHIAKLLSNKQTEPPIVPILNPRIADAEKLLTSENENVYLDIETSPSRGFLLCIGLTTDKIFPRVVVLPIYNYEGKLSVQIEKLYRLLSCLFTNNTVVIHNSMFDLLVLRAFYRLPLPTKVYDTMLANHRCFPEAEKSLKHVIAQHTWQPYHKADITDPYNANQQSQLWTYNAKDVYNLVLIKRAQEKYAAARRGLAESISQVNSSIIPYLENTVEGLNINLLALSQEESRLKDAQLVLQRIINILLSRQFNAASSKQCRGLFFDEYNYQPSIFTPSGEPGTGKKALYQLLIKYKNPIIKIILRYRETSKALSNLTSELWTLK